MPLVGEQLHILPSIQPLPQSNAVIIDIPFHQMRNLKLRENTLAKVSVQIKDRDRRQSRSTIAS